MDIVVLRPACLEDAAAILEIYAPYVRDTVISFEYEPPTLTAFTARMARIMETYPYLVAEREGRIVGYAYASRHMERQAYDWDVEMSVYLDSQIRGQGIGRALYSALFGLLRELGYYNAYAIVALSGQGSLAFHQRMGFAEAGIHHRSGYKFGAWHDVAWLEKPLQESGAPVDPPRRVADCGVNWMAERVRTFTIDL